MKKSKKYFQPPLHQIRKIQTNLGESILEDNSENKTVLVVQEIFLLLQQNTFLPVFG